MTDDKSKRATIALAVFALVACAGLAYKSMSPSYSAAASAVPEEESQIQQLVKAQAELASRCYDIGVMSGSMVARAIALTEQLSDEQSVAIKSGMKACK